MPLTRPADWHAQDWLLVAEALATYAGNPRDLDDRGERAYDLVEAIAVVQGLRPRDLILQIDE